ncbi:FAD-dependent monooxygenase [Bradyrhizobium canariense]|uniref:6-hydroxynicotinate 3-monooxygenase n=1 Tax=Bradyrhizobium canariense TaxID=255045 RepID=A0A1H1NJD6_9BRAD|nr:FAD-dependent monooxygenase [Bradyrhizobium canariense]SDR99068.1 6-hydroxynicotinate 3-monooxygenase [Bradyrhizobium canariense]
MTKSLSVAIIGAGMGGLASAAALRRIGTKVTVYEQAAQFSRLGAGIQIGCNAMKVLRGLGLEQRLRQQSFYPRSWNNRDWRTGEVKFDMIFGEAAEQKFGAPYLLAHRGDLHAALASAVPPDCVKQDHKLVGLDETGAGVRLTFANGATAVADAVVAADGVHSIAKDIMFGASSLNYTGRIAYRTTFPAALLNGYKIDDCTKWWGEDRHIVIYYVKPDRSEVYFVTSQPEPDFKIESWSAKGDVRELRTAFEGFDRQVETVLAACPDVHKWALVDRDSLDRWSLGNVTLLGDSCHPMTPYMAQGAAMAIEDAAVLSRCLAGVDRDGVANAFRRFEASRKPRTSLVQQTSRTNTWLKDKTDTDWVYAYDAWTTPLAA